MDTGPCDDTDERTSVVDIGPYRIEVHVSQAESGKISMLLRGMCQDRNGAWESTELWMEDQAFARALISQISKQIQAMLIDMSVCGEKSTGSRRQHIMLNMSEIMFNSR